MFVQLHLSYASATASIRGNSTGPAELPAQDTAPKASRLLRERPSQRMGIDSTRRGNRREGALGGEQLQRGGAQKGAQPHPAPSYFAEHHKRLSWPYAAISMAAPTRVPPAQHHHGHHPLSLATNSDTSAAPSTSHTPRTRPRIQQPAPCPDHLPTCRPSSTSRYRRTFHLLPTTTSVRMRIRRLLGGIGATQNRTEDT